MRDTHTAGIPGGEAAREPRQEDATPEGTTTTTTMTTTTLRTKFNPPLPSTVRREQPEPRGGCKTQKTQKKKKKKKKRNAI